MGTPIYGLYRLLPRDRVSVFISHMIKTKKIVTVQSIISRIWYIIDDCNINNVAKNQDSAVFHARAIRRSVSPKFCFGWRRQHKHGGRNVTKASVVKFCYCRFSHDVTKIQTTKLLILLIFYFNEV